MGDVDIENKPMAEQEQNTNGLPNGLSNGTSEHKDHKHKSKDKDRDRERDKDKDRHRDKDRHKSSHKDKDRDKDKERSRDKDRHSSSHKSSHKDRDKEKDKEKDKNRDKDKERHKDKDREHHKEKERSDKEKERSRDDKHKDRDRKDKNDKHRDKSREKDKERHKDEKKSSSSSNSKKDKHHSSSHKSSHKDKHRDKDRRDTKIEIKEEKSEVKLELEASIKQEPDVEENGDVNFSTSDSFHNLKVEVKSESDENSLHIKEEPVDQIDSSQYSHDMNDHPVKEDSEEDSQLVIKEEAADEDDDDDIPLSARKRPKPDPDYNEDEDEDEDDKPLIARKKMKSEKRKRKNRDYDDDDDDDEDFKPTKKKIKREDRKEKKPKIKAEKESKSNSVTESPLKGRKKKEAEEEQNVWKWWEEEKREDGKKWTFLEHKGPVFADAYERLPSHVKFYYDGSHMILSEPAEEVAGFYAKMLDHDYTTKEVFNKNFFKDWRKVMSEKERTKISDLSKCDFRRIHEYYVQKNEERKNRTKEEKKALKEKNDAVIAEYGWCNIDGHKQRIGNFKIEPPGLFRGRGEHPKQGMLKRRTMPEDVIINCSKDSKIPKPPAGHKWKEVRSDPNVTWLACWNENIQGSTKYVMLNAASKLKGEKDWQKYETARRLHLHVDKIRENYRMDWKSKEMRIRQRGVALYFIDKLALRAGNEKDEDQADTVGCCSLRFEHLALHPQKDGKEFVVVFDFLGKDSIRYYNEVPVEKRVFKNLQLFMENKQEGDDIFDRLNTQILNKYLNELLEGLTAKVFRTYNASRTLQEQLEKMTNSDDPIPAKILSYNRANREVAILCNHQRAVPKTFDKSMANLQKKIDDKKEQLEAAEKEMKSLKKAAKHGGAVKEKVAYEKKKKAVDRMREQLDKLEISATDKEENKQIALGTSKLNYLDPRITVAWCKKFGVPIDKVYNKTQRQKFQWAIDMATAEYNFMNQDNNEKFAGKPEDEDEEEED